MGTLATSYFTQLSSSFKKKIKIKITLDYSFFPVSILKKLESVFCKMCVLFPNEISGKGNSVKVDALVNKPFMNWKNAIEYFTTHSNADYHKLSTLKADEFVKIIENKTFDAATQVDSFKKAQVIQNHLK